MTTVKEQLAELTAETNKTADKNRNKMAALVAQLMATLADDAAEVTLDDLGALTPEMRKLALIGLCLLFVETLKA